MRTTTFPDASAQAPRVGRTHAMRDGDATEPQGHRAAPDSSRVDTADRSSLKSGSPSERADGSDPVWLSCAALAIALLCALTEWPQLAIAALLQAVLP